MTGGLIASAVLIWCVAHSAVESAAKLYDPGADKSTLELLHVVSQCANRRSDRKTV